VCERKSFILPHCAEKSVAQKRDFHRDPSLSQVRYGKGSNVFPLVRQLLKYLGNWKTDEIPYFSWHIYKATNARAQDLFDLSIIYFAM